jgi:hypothetical protein
VLIYLPANFVVNQEYHSATKISMNIDKYLHFFAINALINLKGLVTFHDNDEIRAE